MKRICLFAGFNSNGTILPYVIDYLKELAKFTDVYYLADGKINEGELSRLEGICKGAWVSPHGKYDFGSYSELLKNYVGWSKVQEYHEVIFCNDSCFCVNTLEPVFERMSGKHDAWCLLATDENNHEYFHLFDVYKKIPSVKIPLFCMGSYFLGFKTETLLDPLIRPVFENVKKEKNRVDVCLNYEMRLTALLTDNDYNTGSYVKQVYRNASIYDLQSLKLVKEGFPLVKVKIFRDNPLSIPRDLLYDTNFIRSHFPSEKIFSYLESVECLNDGTFESKLRNKPNWKDELIPHLFKHNTLKLAIAQILPPLVLRKLVPVVKAGVAKVKPIVRDVKESGASINNLKQTPLSGRISNMKPSSKILNEEWMVYFNVSRDVISGGMLSINRFVDSSIKFEEHGKFKLFQSGVPLVNEPVTYSGFKASKDVRHINELASKGVPVKATLNIPEVFVPSFLKELTEPQKLWLLRVPELRINILNQNNNYMPDRCYVEMLRDLTTDVSMSTAHIEYCTQEISNKYQVPVSLLTPYIPEFNRKPFHKKEKVIVLSPDSDAFNKNITRHKMRALLETKLPDYRLVVVEGLTLEQYKELISKAMFTITFGEGYDGYFIEPALSSSVSFTVHNKVFFPKEFNKLDNMYTSIEEMYENIVDDIRKLESSPSVYAQLSKDTEFEIKRFTNDELSNENLSDFYDRNVDYLPSEIIYPGYKPKVEKIANND